MERGLLRENRKPVVNVSANVHVSREQLDPDLKQVHPCCDHRNFGFIVLKPKAEACPEQEDRQEREGEEEQVPPAPSINREHCG
jgi:hypothetical protein